MPFWSVVLATLVGTGGTALDSADGGDAAAERMVASAPLRFVFDPAAQDTAPAGMSADPMGADPMNSDPMAADPATTDEMSTGPEPLVAPFGTAGSSRWYIHGGRGAQFDETSNTLTLLGLGYSHFIGRVVSMNLELNGIGYSQFGEDAVGANFNLLFRWHFLVERDFTVYFDGGAGVQYTNEDVPRLASKFNFTPQGGIGMSLDIGRDNRLLFGCRWQHVSNANLFDSNPGRDSFLGYVMLNFPF